MISICIPIYNFKVDQVVGELLTQIENLPVEAELILIDDCSTEVFQKHNKHQALNESVSFIQLEENVGRSAIRNLYLKYAKYEHLLFLDCDSLIVNIDFIQNYFEAIKSNPKAVVCGGRVYPEAKAARNKRLRWKYGIKREQKSAAERKKNPYASFMTNNFLIPKQLLQNIQFNEQLKGYGHEDTLFGFELKKKAVAVIHIDNTILNGEIENNADYLKNTENAIQNLKTILETKSFNQGLIQDISLLRLYFKVSSLKYLIVVVFYISKPFIRWSLLKGWVNLYLFDFYKIGYLNQIMLKQK